MLFLHREEGQGLVEYALILVLIALVVIAVLTLLGPTVGNVFTRLSTSLSELHSSRRNETIGKGAFSPERALFVLATTFTPAESALPSLRRLAALRRRGHAGWAASSAALRPGEGARAVTPVGDDAGGVDAQAGAGEEGARQVELLGDEQRLCTWKCAGR